MSPPSLWCDTYLQFFNFTGGCFHISLFGRSCIPIKLTRRSYRERKLHKIICKEQAVHHASCHSETLVDVAARSDPVYVDYEAKCRQYTTLPKTNRRRNGFISVDTDTKFKKWNKTIWWRVASDFSRIFYCKSPQSFFQHTVFRNQDKMTPGQVPPRTTVT